LQNRVRIRNVGHPLPNRIHRSLYPVIGPGMEGSGGGTPVLMSWRGASLSKCQKMSKRNGQDVK
jgi:hypothetical protein